MIDKAKFRLYKIEDIRTYIKPHVNDINKVIKLFELGVATERKIKLKKRDLAEKKRYRQSHPDKIRLDGIKWRKEHPDYMTKYIRKWRKSHPTYDKIHNKEYYYKKKRALLRPKTKEGEK